jgi:hypothetical protein
VSTPAVQYQYFRRYCCPFGALFGGQLIPTLQIPAGVLQVIVQVPAVLPELHKSAPNAHPVPVQPVIVTGTGASAGIELANENDVEFEVEPFARM